MDRSVTPSGKKICSWAHGNLAKVNKLQLQSQQPEKSSRT